MSTAAQVAPTHSDASSSPTLSRDLISATVTAQIAGLIMAVVVMLVFTLFLGKGPLYPVQVIGSLVFGDAALVGFHLPAFLTGLVLHQAGPAVVWGLVFGMLVHHFQTRAGLEVLAVGVIVGLLSQVIDVDVVMPVAMKALHGHDIWAEQVPTFWSWAAHLVFGLGLALFPSVERRLS